MLTLDWHPIEIDNIEGLEQAGDQREVKKLRKKQADERDRYGHYTVFWTELDNSSGSRFSRPRQ